MNTIGWGILAAGIYIASAINPRDEKDKNYHFNNGVDCFIVMLAVTIMLRESFK